MKKPDDKQEVLDQRQPYEPPRVVSEEVFETLALSCAKANPLSCPSSFPDRS